MSELDFAYGDDYSDDYSDDDGDVYSHGYGRDYCGSSSDDGDSPKTAVYSGAESFSYNDELTEVTFAEGVTTIGDSAFEGCSSLAAITIPD